MDVGVILTPSSSAFGLTFVAQQAERLGYESLWVGEHIAIPVDIRSLYPHSTSGLPPFRYDTPWSEAMVALGFLAAVTNRVRIGTAVIPFFNRDPLSLAKQAATVDLLSNGRLELGVGAGWLVEEAAALGHPSDHRAGRLEEAIDIMRKAWSHSSFDHCGRFYRFPAVGVHPHPPQGAKLPLWIGGTRPAALRTATSRATGIIVSRLEPEEVLRLARHMRAMRPDIRIAANLSLDMDEHNMLHKARAFRDSGADRLLLKIEYNNPEDAVMALASFARAVIPQL